MASTRHDSGMSPGRMRRALKKKSPNTHHHHYHQLYATSSSSRTSNKQKIKRITAQGGREEARQGRKTQKKEKKSQKAKPKLPPQSSAANAVKGAALHCSKAPGERRTRKRRGTQNIMENRGSPTRTDSPLSLAAGASPAPPRAIQS